MKNTVRLVLLIALLLLATLIFLCASCSHKPISSPKEVNDYLNKVCHMSAEYGWESAVDGVSIYEMHEKLEAMLVESGG